MYVRIILFLLVNHIRGEYCVFLILEDFFSVFFICVKIANPKNLSYFSVLSYHKLSKALICCWRNCQLDVSGCPTLHGSDDFPEYVVVCTTPDISSFVFPLAGTDIVTFLQIFLNDVQA